MIVFAAIALLAKDLYTGLMSIVCIRVQSRCSLSIMYMMPHSKMSTMPHIESARATIEGHGDDTWAGPVNANQNSPIAVEVS